MKSMKIRIETPCWYAGLISAELPVVLNAQIEYSGLAHVRFSEMIEIPGFFWDEEDAGEGEDYVFLPNEYKIVY